MVFTKQSLVKNMKKKKNDYDICQGTDKGLNKN